MSTGLIIIFFVFTSRSFPVDRCHLLREKIEPDPLIDVMHQLYVSRAVSFYKLMDLFVFFSINLIYSLYLCQ